MKQEPGTNEHEELIFGRNAVLEAIKADTPINHILVTSMTGSLGVICREAKKRGIVVKQADARKLDLMTDNGNHQGVVIRVFSDSRLERRNTRFGNVTTEIHAEIGKVFNHTNVVFGG